MNKGKSNHNKRITLRLPDSLYMMLEAVAEDKNMKVSVLLRKVLENYIRSELGT